MVQPALVSLVSPPSPVMPMGEVMPTLNAPPKPSGEFEDFEDDSDVFVCRRPGAAEASVDDAVTLFVYGWHNVQPGPLSWHFSNMRAALDAVRTMKNAVEWCIVSGREWSTVADARENHAILIEQLG